MQFVDPENYEKQLDAKKTQFNEKFATFNLPELEVFASPKQNYRMRSEFRVWHDGDDLYIALEPEQNESYTAPEPTVVTIEEGITEAQYNQQFLSAVANNESGKALQLVEQAEAAGSPSARSTFVEAIKK